VPKRQNCKIQNGICSSVVAGLRHIVVSVHKAHHILELAQALVLRDGPVRVAVRQDERARHVDQLIRHLRLTQPEKQNLLNTI
jgi:hypothetical protein